MWAIMEGKPKPLSDHQIDEPALWSILARGLAKDRSQRWGSMFEFGQALALWLIDQGVTRDICNSSLKPTWLERSADASAVLHSFFPSDAPKSSDAKPAVLEPPTAAEPTGVSGGAPVHDVAVESKSRIRRSLGARQASTAPGAASKNWLLIGALGGLLSFSGALAYSLSSQTPPKRVAAVEDDEPPSITVRQPSKDLGIATRKDLLPGAAPTAAMRLTDELDTLHEARELATRAATPSKKQPRSAAAKAPAKKPPADLKDPFAGGE
jgi:serine/threonine-protein kinase